MGRQDADHGRDLIAMRMSFRLTLAEHQTEVISVLTMWRPSCAVGRADHVVHANNKRMFDAVAQVAKNNRLLGLEAQVAIKKRQFGVEAQFLLLLPPWLHTVSSVKFRISLNYSKHVSWVRYIYRERTSLNFVRPNFLRAHPLYLSGTWMPSDYEHMTEYLSFAWKHYLLLFI